MRSLALSALALAFTAPLIHAQEGATTGDPNIPVLCEEGCFNVLMAFGACAASDNATAAAESGNNCPNDLCSTGPTGNYANLIACLECMVDNGANFTGFGEGTPYDSASAILSGANSACSSVSGFSTSSFAASATTTGPFTASVTGSETFSVWTGLVPFVTSQAPPAGGVPSGSTFGTLLPASSSNSAKPTAAPSGSSSGSAANPSGSSSSTSSSAAALPTAAPQAGLIMAAAGMAMGMLA